MDLFEAILWLTLNVYHESRSENDMAQRAVAHVTINRAVKRNLTIKEVIFQPYQFSWTHQLTDYTPRDVDTLFICYRNSLDATKEEDFTQGATYFHTIGDKPDWAEDVKKVGVYGSHVFYKDYEVKISPIKHKK